MKIRMVATHAAAAQRKRVLKSWELKWSHAGSDFLPGVSEDIVLLMVMQWQCQEKRRSRR
jgi:hypothetical protein